MRREPWDILISVAALSALLLAGWLIFGKPATTGENKEEPGTSPEHEAETGPNTDAEHAKNPSPGDGRRGARLLEMAYRSVAEHASGQKKDPKAIADRLQRTGDLLMAIPLRESARAILEELAAGRDAKTGLPFRTGDERIEWPTSWRVFLLDLLGCIDPRAAANYARKHVFSSASSPDEWAVSLRNVMLSYPPAGEQAAKREVGERLGQMLENKAWRSAPTGGMMEALDFVAHTQNPEGFVPSLQNWLGENANPRPDLAVQIALERAVIRQPQRLLPALAANNSLLGATPQQRALRASLMARANLGDVQQAYALASYLRGLQPGSDESEAFFRCFPERRYAVSPGLASQPIVPTAESALAADEAALDVLPQWQKDPSLAKHYPSIEALIEKVRELRSR